MKTPKTVHQFLLEHANRKTVSFHMPGHKGPDIYRENGYGEFLDKMMECDITEIFGADNLFQPETVIKDTMERYRRLYHAEKTYLLINGSSAGIIAAIMALVPRGGKAIIARNCHKSIYNAMNLAGARAVYTYPEILEQYGISGELSVFEIRDLLNKNPDASAVIVPSPNYYGICSDIKEIAKEVHKHGKILIVDQAHGAHLMFFDQLVNFSPLAAENLGADIVIDSIHKTLASFTQSAIVNICSDRIDKYLFEDKLQAIESTSPSYLLMASLDINADLIEKKIDMLIPKWADDLKHFYSEAKKIEGLKIVEHPMLDYTKINMDMSAYGLDGIALEKLLIRRKIYPELVTGNIVMCMTGIGNKRADYDRLLHAVTGIAANRTLIDKESDPLIYNEPKIATQLEPPSEKERIPMEKAEGRICAGLIIPYPPGIPIICPGEVITGQLIDYVKNLRENGEKVMGIDENGCISCGKEKNMP